MADYEVDYSEITGKLVSCPEQCGMCCLCQPEVLPEERPFFKKNYPQFLVRTKGPQPYSALALKKGCGSCVFLDNRRCKIYDHRTAYCRQFPYHIYASDKIKVELDLSCRGAWYGTGNDAVSEAKELIKNADSRILEALKDSNAVYHEFYANCKEAGVHQDPSMLRMQVSENVSMFTDLAYLSRIMDMSTIEPIMALSGMHPETHLDMESLQEAGMDLAMESMSSTDPLSVPVYCDEEWNWNRFDATKIKLQVPDEEGVKVLRDYVNTLNQRDSFMGSVFWMMDQNGYEDDMTNAYFGSMAVTVMDLLWRMSMLDHFMGTGVGAEGVREAIIFYDMDRLDAPTIGAFV